MIRVWLQSSLLSYGLDGGNDYGFIPVLKFTERECPVKFTHYQGLIWKCRILDHPPTTIFIRVEISSISDFSHRCLGRSFP